MRPPIEQILLASCACGIITDEKFSLFSKKTVLQLRFPLRQLPAVQFWRAKVKLSVGRTSGLKSTTFLW